LKPQFAKLKEAQNHRICFNRCSDDELNTGGQPASQDIYNAQQNAGAQPGGAQPGAETGNGKSTHC